MQNKRLPYRIADRLPLFLKIPYYIILWVTALYAIYRLLRFILESIQKTGAFIFDKRNYWTVVLSISILLLGSFLVSQFWLGLDPVGKTVQQIKEWSELINQWAS